MTDERWTVERLERVRATVEDDDEMTLVHNRSLLALIDTALDALKSRDEAVIGLERYAKDARDAQREVEELRSVLRRRPNHDETIRAMLSDEVIEQLGLDGRHSVLQVTRLCDELKRLLETRVQLEAEIERLRDELARMSAERVRVLPPVVLPPVAIEDDD